MSKKKKDQIPIKRITAFEEKTTNASQNYPNSTMHPDFSGKSAPNNMLSKDATTAPNIEEESSNEKYVSSVAGLADKYILSPKFSLKVLIIICVVTSAVIFVYDNKTKELSTIESIIWTSEKCLLINMFLFLTGLIIWFVVGICEKSKNKFHSS